MDVAKSDLALVSYAERLLSDGQRVVVGRTGSDVRHEITEIMISADDGVVRAVLFNRSELYLAPGQLGWVSNDY